MRKVENITNEIFGSEECTQEFEKLKSLEEVIEYYRKFDDNISDSDIVDYLMELFDVNGNLSNIKLSDENLCSVNGGQMISKNKLLASFLGALTITTAAPLGTTKAAGLWDNMSTTEKAVTVGSGVVGVTALATTIGMAIHHAHKLKKLSAKLDNRSKKIEANEKQTKLNESTTAANNKKIDINRRVIVESSDPEKVKKLEKAYTLALDHNTKLKEQLGKLITALAKIGDAENRKRSEYKRLKAEYDQLVKDISYFENLPSENAKLEQKISNIKNENSKLAAKIHSLTAEMVALHIKCSQM